MITAVLSVNGVFIQPESEISCLKKTPQLGLKLVQPNGLLLGAQPVQIEAGQAEWVSSVNVSTPPTSRIPTHFLNFELKPVEQAEINECSVEQQTKLLHLEQSFGTEEEIGAIVLSS